MSPCCRFLQRITGLGITCVLGLAAASSAREATDPLWPRPPQAIEAVVAEALDANLSLAEGTADVDRAAARLAAARSHYYPRIDLVARYSRADGGRTIDFPAGDLLNPVYRTLNDLTGSAAFPEIENVSIAFLRSREQETKLRLIQSLYRPEIADGADAARAQLDAAQARFAALRRDIRQQTQEALFAHQQETASVRIYQAALQLVEESLRVNRALRAEEKVTPDVVLRAEAEAALVREQLAGARRDETLSAAYINVLLDRPLGTPIEMCDPQELERYRARLLEPDLFAGSLSAAGREELAALESALAAANSAAKAAGTRRRPTVSLAVEAGTQGEDYRLGTGTNFAEGSLVAEWNIFDGRERNAGVAEARAVERAVAAQVRAVRNQFAFQLEQAREDFRVAAFSLEAATQRVTSARAAYAVVSAREREGAAPQIVVLDARTTLTDAEIGAEIAGFRLFTAAARIDRAAAILPLP